MLGGGRMGSEAMAVGGWGTWEELVLGGAVLRHGTNDWNVVASELRARTLYPHVFTPQACKERYEDLQKRYLGSTAWFVELRKQRVAELKQELAKSKDSIGSLESKLKSLMCEKIHSSRANSSSNETQSPSRAFDSNFTEPLSLEASNNENSAGSFTKDTITRTNLSFENQDDNKDLCVKKLAESNYCHGVVMRKRRGQRSRKDGNRAMKERSVGESDDLCSNVDSTVQKELSGIDCGQLVRESGANDRCEDSCSVRKDGLIGIFKSVAKSEPAVVFRHRMDSQKRARYRKVIKQHVDIGTIKSRIVGQSIKSAKELFRDLLLVANNALVFYSRRTREYKSAVSLRNVVMKEYKKHCMGSCHESTPSFIPCYPPVKPRTARPRPPPCKDRVPQKALSADNVVHVNGKGLDNQSVLDDNVSRDCVFKARKEVRRPGKLKHGLADKQNKSCVKQRKRVGR